MYENPSVHPILAGLIGIAAGVGIGYLAFKPAATTTPAAGAAGLPGLGLTNPLAPPLPRPLPTVAPPLPRPLPPTVPHPELGWEFEDVGRQASKHPLPPVVGNENPRYQRNQQETTGTSGFGAVGRQTTQAQLVQNAHSNGMAYGVASARWLIMNGRPVEAIDPSGIGVAVPAPFNTWGTAAVHGFQGGFVLGYNQVRNSAQAKAQNALATARGNLA
jgi:hypothetical protein